MIPNITLPAADAIVGTAQNSACCPLATWVRATTGQMVYVRCLDIALDPDAPYDWKNDMPEWMTDFITVIDAYAIDYGERNVTAAAALEVFVQVQRDAGMGVQS